MLDFVIFAVTFVVILVGAVLYLYPSSRCASGVPGLNPTEEKDGNLQDIVNKGSLHEFLVGLHEQFGSVASFWFGRRPVVSLGSVDQLRQHINPNRTTDSFETMLKSLLGYQSGTGMAVTEALMRKKVYEGAINKTLDKNFPLLLKLVEELVGKWESYPESQHTPICAHLLGLAMKAVTQMAMGARFADDAEVIRFRKNHEAIWSEIGKGFLDGSLEKSYSRKACYASALAEMESVLKSVIKENSGRGSNQLTFMDSLLQAKLSERQVTSLPTPLQSLGVQYCQQVLSETVRAAKLTPIAARLQEVEGKVDGHVIPKETLVIYALGVVLQDADTWTLPYRFDPDRFTDESVMKSFSLLGFSGNQACPELRFAYTVAAVLLSALVQKLRLHRVEGQVVESRYELVTRPKDDTWITVSKRN
uniref:Cytochrome P450, family 20, subfamily A, polypeptide 1 n=1 Tax=Electrophorus electricus TaxID=8005 RepID=A0A4W4F256_ELEEL